MRKQFNIKTITILLFVLSSEFTSANASEDKFYVQFNGGAAFAQPFSESREISLCIFPSCGIYSSTLKEKYDTGFAASVALGYHITDAFRLEGEAMYQSNDLHNLNISETFQDSTFNFSRNLKGERERTAFLLNAYYDFKNSSDFTPFVTAGVGGYHLRIKSSRFNFGRPSRDNDLDFAWQVGAGVNYRMNDRISFDLKYRYFSGSDAEVSYPSPIISVNQPPSEINELHEVGDHQVMAGIRVGF